MSNHIRQVGQEDAVFLNAIAGKLAGAQPPALVTGCGSAQDARELFLPGEKDGSVAKMRHNS